jgi:hypothetical protein
MDGMLLLSILKEGVGLRRHTLCSEARCDFEVGDRDE